MPDVIATLKKRVAERITHGITTIAAAAQALAAGRDVDVTAIEAALRDTQTSPEEFEARVALLRERHQRRQTFERLADAQKLRGELEEKGIRATTRFECEWQKHAAALERLQAEKHQADAVIAEALAARNWLLDVNNLIPPLRDDITTAREAKRAATETLVRIETQIRDLEATAKHHSGWIKHLTKQEAETVVPLSPEDRADQWSELQTDGLEDLDRHVRKLRRTEADLATLRPQLAAAQAEATKATKAVDDLEATALSA